MEMGYTQAAFPFPSDKKKNPVGNSAANTQLFIDLLDSVSTYDARSIKAYFQGDEDEYMGCSGILRLNCCWIVVLRV